MRKIAKKKRINPRHKPATQADVNRAKRQAQDNAIITVWAIFFTVMRDKEGYGPKRLLRLWDRVNDLSDSITMGYVSVKDLVETIDQEMGIKLEGFMDGRS